MTRSQCSVVAPTEDMSMTLCSSERKVARSGKPRENDCKTNFAGGCRNVTSSCTAASEWNTTRTKESRTHYHRMNSLMNCERYRSQVILGNRKKVHCLNKSKQNWEDCWVDSAGNVNRQDYSTVLPQDLRSRIEQSAVQDMIEANRIRQQVKKERG